MNILSRFEKIVNDYPDKTAIADENSSCSFSELKREAIHRSLLLAGKADQPIGVLIDRSTTTIINILSVLYSGNYYVPLDPKMPEEKLRSIIEETGMPVILSSDSTEGIFEQLHFVNDVQEKADSLELPLQMEDFDHNRPLYMVYTSGSTGKPKGVLKSHLSMISFMDAYIKKYGFSSTDIIGNQSPFFFDAAAKDLYLMMFSGATMEIIPSNLFASPYNLVDYLNQKKINFISWVPSMLSIIVQVDTFDDIVPKYLDKVFFVGETFPIKQLKKWISTLPDIKYVNLFGSSEVAGVFTTYDINEISDDLDFLPIGKAMPNCGVYLIDGSKVITEPGVLGEVYVSGDSLATCYYNDEEKTKQKFIVSDNITGKNERYFVTGDIAKYDSDGNLVFVTRKDFQIKRMGHRIELGEIEAKANACPLIKRSCCVYNETNKQLVLFYEPAADDIKAKEIKSFLKENLSDYMVPNKIKEMESLPLNANGKINRKLLKDSIL